MGKNKHYTAPSQISKEEALKAFGSENTETILDALLGIINGVDDHDWVVLQLLKYVNHSDRWVAGAAIGGLGECCQNL